MENFCSPGEAGQPESFPGEKRAKYGDCSRLFQVPEKRARFERTADMLAKSGLLDITMKTAELIRSNQQAKNELMKLKVEIDEFVQKVLANPENQVKQKYWCEQYNCTKHLFILCCLATSSANGSYTVYLKSSSCGRSSCLAEGFSN